ncbi:MAG: nucleotide-binding domain containing protein, partial [Burkholderiales bacterium]
TWQADFTHWRLADGTDVAGQALAFARERLSAGPVLVFATAEPDSVRAVQAKLGVAKAGELVEHTLAAVARGLVEAGVRRLVVAGGETSGAVVQALGVERMAIGPQIDPGVPWTAVTSAACAGETVHLALKSGNFGTVDFFTKAFARLA